MQQPSKQGGERQPPSQTAAKVSKARTPLCAQEMGALPAGEEWESLSLSPEGGASRYHTHQAGISSPQVALHSPKLGFKLPTEEDSILI